MKLIKWKRGNELLAVMCLLLFSFYATALPLSEKARISLLTCSQGNELYSCFGHSGIRVTDPELNADIVFNYGVFDFGQPNFYLNFMRGHMIYSMGIDRYSDFYDQYVYEKRDISEQEIILPLAEKQRIFDFLLNNAKEENRNYRYDFLFDNCATRIREVFEKNLGMEMQIDYSSFDKNLSFRDLIDEYSWDKYWENFGMNLLIGLPVDAKATPSQQTFLPDYLSKAFANSYFINADGTKRKLCSPPKIVLKAKPIKDSFSFEITPLIVFLFLFITIALITFIELRKGFNLYVFDVFLFFVAGFLGLLFLSLWLFTEHTTTARNLNLLWAIPTHLFFAFLLLSKRKSNLKRNYFLVTLVIQLLFIAFHSFLPQHIQPAMVFISGILAVRAYRIYKSQIS
jgi:hypothetical protein